MSESVTTTEIYSDASGYWKMCTIVLGIGFVIAVASHGGPASASASSSDANLLTAHQSQAAIQVQQVLSIGGFDMVDGQAAFVILDEQGQRIGALPMSAMSDD